MSTEISKAEAAFAADAVAFLVRTLTKSGALDGQDAQHVENILRSTFDVGMDATTEPCRFTELKSRMGR